MRSAQELITLFYENTRNFPSQTLYAPGEKYTMTPSKRYVSHPYDLNPNCSYRLPESPRVKSSRHFTEQAMKQEELFSLLHSSYQVTSIESSSHALTPSAGGLFPVQIYVFVRHVQEARTGIYAYDREAGGLTYLGVWTLDFLPPVNRFVEQAAVFLLMTVNPSQLIKKYGARGFRYALLECGHIGQMLALAAERIGLGGCAIGGLYDQKLEALLQLQAEEFPVYGYCFGHVASGGNQS